MADKVFDPPWAESGDKNTIPNTAQPSGSASYPEGWTPDYEADQGAGPPAKDVDREIENQFKFDVTGLLKEVQQNGLPLYDARYNYEIGAYTLASDGIAYQALLANGPSTTIRDPINDATGTWLSSRGDIRNYIATFDYRIGDYVKGTDGVLYQAIQVNGPATTVRNPVGDTTGTWLSLRGDIRFYASGTDYRVGDYVKGIDAILYRAAIVNGPSTSVVSPIGDATGTWIVVGGSALAMTTTVFTADDPSWVPNSLAKTLKATVTAAGGGGGGAEGADTGKSSQGSVGGAGATAVKTISGPLDASYAIVVGAGGPGGDSTGSPGATGQDSSFDGASITIVEASGGFGGAGDINATTGESVVQGGPGGQASGGDLNIAGGDGGSGRISSGINVSIATGGASYWGGGASNTPNSAGDDAPAIGSGAGGGCAEGSTTGRDGGDGADGVVVVEEYF